jgi:hypothetical protein
MPPNGDEGEGDEGEGDGRLMTLFLSVLLIAGFLGSSSALGKGKHSH